MTLPTTTAVYDSVFDTDNVTGNFQILFGSDGTATYAWDFDITNLATLTEADKMDIMKNGIKYHIHEKWTPTSKNSSSTCTGAVYGGHYDPYLACGEKSGYHATLCASLNRTLSSGYTYKCNPDNYLNKGFYNYCEIGDISGKFGAMKCEMMPGMIGTGVTISGNNNTGVYTSGNNDTGVFVSGNENTGVYTSGNNGTGVFASGNDNIGVYTNSNNGTGVFASGNENTGVYTSGNNGTGEYTNSNNGTGVFASGNENTGVYTSGNNGTGVFTSGNNGTGVFASGNGNNSNNTSMPMMPMPMMPMVLKFTGIAMNDINPPLLSNYGPNSMNTLSAPWISIVFHRPTAPNDAFYCAKLLPVSTSHLHHDHHDMPSHSINLDKKKKRQLLSKDHSVHSHSHSHNNPRLGHRILPTSTSITVQALGGGDNSHHYITGTLTGVAGIQIMESILISVFSTLIIGFFVYYIYRKRYGNKYTPLLCLQQHQQQQQPQQTSMSTHTIHTDSTMNSEHYHHQSATVKNGVNTI